jgi:DNA-binding NtrC family response regulator
MPRLLVIDDEPKLGEYLAAIARDTGFAPEVTTQDQQFRARFLEDRSELVALDLGMPGMDGVELLRFLAEQRFDLPVLIVSGFDRRVLESAFRLGEALGLKMAGPIEKPMRADILEEILTDLKGQLPA